MANRSTLHISKLDAFKEWLVKDGWKLEEPKGRYEVLRARKQGRKNPLLVYEKLDAKEHLSLLDRDTGVIGAFLRDSKKPQTNADRTREMTIEELAMTMMCPNENGLAEIECDRSDNCNCYECCLKWLRSEVEVDNE